MDHEVFSEIKLTLEVIDLNGQTEDQRDTGLLIFMHLTIYNSLSI